MIALIREKFDVLLISFVFLVCLGLWFYSGFRTEITVIVLTLLGAEMTLLGIRPRTPTTVNADIETANISGGENQPIAVKPAGNGQGDL